MYWEDLIFNQFAYCWLLIEGLMVLLSIKTYLHHNNYVVAIRTILIADKTDIIFIFQGLGTDEATLIEIMMTRTNAQVKEMVEQYNLSKNLNL